MESLIFILFLVAIQVGGSLLEARKKRKEYAEKVRRSAETAHHNDPPFPQWPAEAEDLAEEEISPFRSDEETDPSPIPPGLRELQELFQRFANEKDEPKEEQRENIAATSALIKTPHPALPRSESLQLQRLNSENIRSAILFSEILGKPKALRHSPFRRF